MTSSALLAGAKFLTAGGQLILLPTSPAGGGGGSSGLANVAAAGYGQSNAAYANDTDGALLAGMQAAAFYLGASGTTAKYSSSGGTDYAGCGSYPSYSSDPFISFLAFNGATAAAAAAASVTSYGTGLLNYFSSLSSGQRASIQAIWIYWGETDSLMFYYGGVAGTTFSVARAIIKAALLNLLAQVRAVIGKSAAQLPAIMFGPPYNYGQSTAPGSASMWEIWAELAANSANNVVFAPQQTYDANPRGALYNTSTGLVGGTGQNGDSGHRDAVDNLALYKRAGLAAARAILAANGLSASLIPSALGTGLGPQITVAQISGTTVNLTISHDAGTDLAVPLLASQGVGFSVMDGGNTASPGNFILATSCAYVDATHLRLTLPSAPTNSPANCRLNYPWPTEYWTAQPIVEIGRGDAVTDNFASISKPSGFDINASLGAGWGANMPLCPPIVITGSGSAAAAQYGLPLTS